MSEPITSIGSLLSGDEQRDAIHVAIAPVVAAVKLKPGQEVGFISKEENTVGHSAYPIGIIDPYLDSTVKAGQRCWLFLFPNTVTSLRHEWTHPAFPDGQVKVVQHSDSRRWLEAWAAAHEFTYNAVMSHAAEYLAHGEYWHGGSDHEGIGVGDEFWDHYGKVVGAEVPSHNRGSFFSCSC